MITTRCAVGSSYDDYYYKGSLHKYESRGKPNVCVLVGLVCVLFACFSFRAYSSQYLACCTVGFIVAAYSGLNALQTRNKLILDLSLAATLAAAGARVLSSESESMSQPEFGDCVGLRDRTSVRVRMNVRAKL